MHCLMCSTLYGWPLCMLCCVVLYVRFGILYEPLQHTKYMYQLFILFRRVLVAIVDTVLVLHIGYLYDYQHTVCTAVLYMTQIIVLFLSVHVCECDTVYVRVCIVTSTWCLRCCTVCSSPSTVHSVPTYPPMIISVNLAVYYCLRYCPLYSVYIHHPSLV